jgi:radical SAM superfamily enzyme YgiQ (UPF0313 family)
VNVVLISTYELGRQPFGIASPAAWLGREGHSVVCADLAVSAFPEAAVRQAELVAFYLPMHTATRLTVRAIARVRLVNPAARLACYGLYAPLNGAYLRGLGVSTVLGGEFESGLAALARGEAPEGISLVRQEFLTPDRSGLPPLSSYAHLHIDGEPRAAGYTEASRGCKHMCRHCPVVPVYGGRFRIVQPEVVIEDIRRQVEAGARHITFGDPDFFNGPGHAVRIVEAVHREWPSLTYDVTIKIEHLLQHAELLPVLTRTGCLFVTTAVESLEDEVLAKLEKGHTRRDFFRVVEVCRAAGLALAPTFVPFTPWTTWEGYRDLLRVLADLNFAAQVSPVQLGLRLLITAGSRLLELEDVRASIGGFDQESLVYPWRHRDPSLDRLSEAILARAAKKRPREETFRVIWELAWSERLPENFDLMPRATVPYLDEPWYC